MKCSQAAAGCPPRSSKTTGLAKGRSTSRSGSDRVSNHRIG